MNDLWKHTEYLQNLIKLPEESEHSIYCRFRAQGKETSSKIVKIFQYKLGNSTSDLRHHLEFKKL